MDRSLRIRSFVLVGIVLACFVYLLPTFVGNDRLPSWFGRIFDKKITLGLDLQGGAQFDYSIDLDKAVDDKATDVKRDVEAKLAEKGIKATVSTPAIAPGAIAVKPADPAQREEIARLVKSDYGDVIQGMTCPKGDLEQAVCVRISSKFADGVRRSALSQAIITIRDRIDAKGVAEPTVIARGDRILVELPGLDPENIQRIRELIARTAKLEFKIVIDSTDNDPYMQKLFARVAGSAGSGGASDPAAIEAGITAHADSWNLEKKPDAVFYDWYLTAYDREESLTVAEARKQGCYRKDMPEQDGKVRCKVTGRTLIERYLAQLAAQDPTFKVPDGRQIGFEKVQPDPSAERADKREYWRTYYLDRTVHLTGGSVSSAQVNYDQNTLRPEVVVVFDRHGSRVWGDLTGANVGKKIAIILDETVASAPIIQGAITQGATTVTMGGADPQRQEAEAQDLVNVLKTGSLPAPLREESTAELGPTLGRDAVDKAQLSFGLGIVLVVVIMVGLYRWSGFVAIFAVAVNILMMLAVMAMFGATLTLPGIAAVVLTVGMSVDGNVLIYERIRDELLLGKSVKGAVEVGFQRAFSSILDGQLTTAVAGWVLLQYGSGPIKGFAIMLLVGIATTLFTSIWVTRYFFDLFTAKKKGDLATLSI